MAKKTTKPAEKAAPKKKPVTMAERIRRIELDVNRHGANMAAITAAMREQLTSIAEEAMRASTMAHHARTNSRGNTVILNKIQSDLSLLLSGASFMQELDKHAHPTEEQGLEPGDYTDASKEVADELTAMGYQWFDDDRNERPLLMVIDNGRALNFNDWRGDVKRTYLPRAEFLSRARVTAKRLGLGPVEPKPWKPEVGELVSSKTGYFSGASKVVCLRYVNDRSSPPCAEMENGRCDYWSDLRPATPEEVAAYKEQQELAKPIVPYETRVMWEGDECKVLNGPDVQGYYLLHALGTAETVTAKRNEFTAITKDTM